MKLPTIKWTEYSEDEIYQNRLYNVYLFGLPRSGTSMMTHVLELLGVNMIHTSENNRQNRDKIYERKFGEYHPNETGFYEITNNIFENFLKVLSTPYGGCKMIIPVIGYRWDIVKDYPSKVVMMERDVEEIRQSQMAFYAHNVDVAYLRTALAQTKVQLRKNNIDHIVVNYRDVLDNKEYEVSRIADFIRAPNNISEALNFINPKQNRFRREELVNVI